MEEVGYVWGSWLSRSNGRATATTDHPASRSARTVAAPIPELAPVTTARSSILAEPIRGLPKRITQLVRRALHAGGYCLPSIFDTTSWRPAVVNLLPNWGGVWLVLGCPKVLLVLPGILSRSGELVLLRIGLMGC